MSRREILATPVGEMLDMMDCNAIAHGAKRKAQEERAQILADAQKDAAVTIARGKDVIDAERKRAMEDLSKSVIDLSVEIAGKIVGNDLSDDEHRALAAKYLQEVGDSDAR
jgi:F-type H+-transporting ATPase subunit b